MYSLTPLLKILLIAMHCEINWSTSCSLVETQQLASFLGCCTETLQVHSCQIIAYPSNVTHSYLLPRHPQVLKRLREDIQSAAGNGQELKREDIKKMAYLANVLKESMSTKTCPSPMPPVSHSS